MTKSIMMVGVGGQGTITASKLLSDGLMNAGYDVKMSEIHGMSQRGGSVSSQIRYGEEVHSCVIEKGGADILVSFELVETMRYLDTLKADGKMIVNDYKIDSLTTRIGLEDYPENLMEELESQGTVQKIKAADLAMELGNIKVMNIVLLGVLVKSMNLDTINWNNIIEDNIKAPFVELNKKAFETGLRLFC